MDEQKQLDHIFDKMCEIVAEVKQIKERDNHVVFLLSRIESLQDAVRMQGYPIGYSNKDPVDVTYYSAELMQVLATLTGKIDRLTTRIGWIEKDRAKGTYQGG